MPLSSKNQQALEQSELNKSASILRQTSDLEKIIIRKLCRYIESGSLGKLVKNPSLAFGEAYADGLIELEGDLEDVIRLLHLNKNLIEKFTIGKAGQKVATMLRKPSIEREA